MIWLVPLGAMFAATVTLVVLELRRAAAFPAPAPADRRGARGTVLALAAAACCAVFTPGWIVLLLGFDRLLPVAEPAAPSSGEPWSFDFDYGPQFLLIGMGLVTLVRFAPVLVAWLVGRRKRAAELPLPRGLRLSQVAGGIAGAVAVLAAARVAMGGLQPSDFSTHGALTPDSGASGWRLDLVLVDAMADDAELRPLLEDPPLDSELAWDEGNDCCGAFAMMPGWHEVSGLKAWVGEQPVLIEMVPGGTLRWRRVVERDERDFPKTRRPRFQSLPRWAHARDGSYVLVETRPDGGTFAMRSGYSGSLYVRAREVGWLLAAPATPLIVLLVSMFVAFLLARRAAAGSVHGPVQRFAAAWILLEASAATVILYLPYV